MSKLDKDQLDKISGGISSTEKSENFRIEGEQGSDSSRPVGVYLEDETNAELNDNGGAGPTIQPDRG